MANGNDGIGKVQQRAGLAPIIRGLLTTNVIEDESESRLDGWDAVRVNHCDFGRPGEGDG
jgi:hypothetical protein